MTQSKNNKVKKLGSDDLSKLYKIFLKNSFNELMEFINEYGLDAVDENRNNILLHCVSDKSFIMLVNKMMDHLEEININFQNKFGISALHVAVRYKNKQLLDLLLKNKNINVNIYDNNGNTPLSIALMDVNFDEDIIIKLLESGADVNQSDKYGYRLYDFVNESMGKVGRYLSEHNNTSSVVYPCFK